MLKIVFSAEMLDKRSQGNIHHKYSKNSYIKLKYRIMKRLLVFYLLFSFSYFAIAQSETVGNFKVYNNNLIWQKIVETDMSFDELINEVKGKGIIENPHVEEGVIQGLTILFPTSYRVISGTMTTSFYLQGDISGHIKVEYRENRYRITFTDSYAHFETLNLAGRMELTKSPINDYAIRNNGSFKNRFKRVDYKVLENAFNKAFDFKPTNYESDDW